MIYITEEQAQQIEEALDAVKQMCEVAHPQFNWGASFLQADGVALLNEAPQAATKALATIRAARAQMPFNDETRLQIAYIKGLGDGAEQSQADHSEQNLNMVQEQEPVVFEDALEAAYWNFDARVKGYGKWKLNRQSERDAFKHSVRGIYAAPIRTKDLTDDEKLELARSSIGKSRHWLVEAAIAAYKEKNRV